MALTLRTVSCLIYAAKWGSDDLDTRLFDVLMLQIPYYLVVQVSFAMLFGWYTLRASLATLLSGDTEVTDKIQFTYTLFYGLCSATIYILLLFLLGRGFVLFDKPPTPANTMDYVVFSLLLTIHVILIGLYVYVYYSLMFLLKEVENMESALVYAGSFKQNKNQIESNASL